MRFYEDVPESLPGTVCYCYDESVARPDEGTLPWPTR